jgi:hypothetical protein
LGANGNLPIREFADAWKAILKDKSEGLALKIMRNDPTRSKESAFPNDICFGTGSGNYAQGSS